MSTLPKAISDLQPSQEELDNIHAQLGTMGISPSKVRVAHVAQDSDTGEPIFAALLDRSKRRA